MNGLQRVARPAGHFITGDTQIFQSEDNFIQNGCRDELIVRILKNQSGLLTNLPEVFLVQGIQMTQLYLPLSWLQQSVH
ncbi:hypothetical protein D3C87_1918120 [compost metagenome]